MMYQHFKDPRANFQNKFYSYRGLHDIIHDTIYQSERLNIVGPFDTMSGNKKIPYDKYTIKALMKDQKEIIIELHTRKEQYLSSYTDPTGETTGKSFKGEHFFAIVFPWGSLSDLRQSYFITTRDGQCWCYETDCGDKLVHNPSRAEEEFIGLIHLLARIRAFGDRKIPLITYERTSTKIGDVTTNRTIEREEKHLKYEFFDLDLLTTRMKSYTNTTMYVESCEYGFVTTILSLQGGGQRYDFRIRCTDGFNPGLYTGADPFVTIYTPRYFAGVEEQVIEIMDRHGSYRVRDKYFDIRKDEHYAGGEDPSLRELLSYLGSKGVAGGLINEAGYCDRSLHVMDAKDVKL